MKKQLSRTMIATLKTLVVSNSRYLMKTDPGYFVALFLFRLHKLSLSHQPVFFQVAIFHNYPPADLPSY